MKTVEEVESNVLRKEDASIHAWYRFVLSYPPHLVRKYASRFSLTRHDLLLDPFCGTGTTLVEAMKIGVPSVGIEAHPFAAMISRVKCDWTVPTDVLEQLAGKICRSAETECAFVQEMPVINGCSLSEDEERVLPTGFLSPRPQGRLLILRHWVEKLTEHQPDSVREFFYLAMANVIAGGAGNFAFGPEIYRTKPKHDYDVIGHFARQTAIMIADLERAKSANGRATHAEVFEADARSLDSFPRRFSAVITSPPYPNEKDYTRTTRVEAVLLRFVEDREGLRSLKENLLRSNTRNVFVKDEDAAEVAEFASIKKVCEEIENRRIELGKTSGFERLYHKVVAHYFGGMRRHFRGLKKRMQPGSHLAYVVGDQYSFLMVPIRTARLLAEVAETEGFKVEGIDLWRERVGTKIRNSSESMRTVRIREEVLRLRS